MAGDPRASLWRVAPTARAFCLMTRRDFTDLRPGDTARASSESASRRRFRWRFSEARCEWQRPLSFTTWFGKLREVWATIRSMESCLCALFSQAGHLP